MGCYNVILVTWLSHARYSRVFNIWIQTCFPSSTSLSRRGNTNKVLWNKYYCRKREVRFVKYCTKFQVSPPAFLLSKFSRKSWITFEKKSLPIPFWRNTHLAKPLTPPSSPVCLPLRVTMSVCYPTQVFFRTVGSRFLPFYIIIDWSLSDWFSRA